MRGRIGPRRKWQVLFYDMKDSYKDIYRRAFKIDWERGKYDIHHINHDHEDNRVENLILLPKDLHQKLHSLLKSARYDWNDTIVNLIITMQMLAENGEPAMEIKWMKEYSDLLIEISMWGFLKKTNYRNPETGNFYGPSDIWSV